jgi:protein O-mannosyl-transferase
MPALRTHPILMSWCAIVVVLFATWFAYRPGLDGTFVFDDFANIPALGATGPVNTGASLARYLTSGPADPTGRPLAMASFLIDGHDWPTDPQPFKRTNVLIHIANGLLLFAALLGLGRELRWRDARRALAALIGAAAWLLHPFFVSTVLYVVQREAMLPATFTLLALLAYLGARRAAGLGNPRRALRLLALGVGACTLLAMLSKANGVLVPLLVLVVHGVLPQPACGWPRFNRWCMSILGPPAVAVVAYVAWTGFAGLGGPVIAIRGWSITQRLLTEPIILWQYMAQLWLVAPGASSLLHDDVQVATSLASPWYTGPAILAWLLAATLAWVARRSVPSLAAALLFFLAGHVVESTSLPLELYFDHRNYLPALLLFWPLGDAIALFRSRTVRTITFAALCSLLLAFTFANARIWGDPLGQARSWAATHPDSARAQAYAAQIESAAGRLPEATATIERAAARFHGEPQIALNLMDIHCKTGGLRVGDAMYARDAFKNAAREPGPLLVTWVTGAVPRAKSGSCAGLTRATLEDVLDGATENRRIMAVAGRQQDIEHLRGVLALGWADAGTALDHFNKALAMAPAPAAALEQAAALGSAGFPELGLRHLDYYATLPQPPGHPWRNGMPWLHDKVLEWQAYWPTEIKALRESLQRAGRPQHPATLG